MEPVGGPLVDEEGGWRFATDPTLLMRFSAATANTHRIHYDWPYATHVEGYPGLVVHGPLSTLALAELLRLRLPHRRVLRVRHRNSHPLFCGGDAHLRLDQATDNTAEVALNRGDGVQLAQLSADLAPNTAKGTTHG
jgi:3-methylfumaryl-CoA hydratase